MRRKLAKETRQKEESLDFFPFDIQESIPVYDERILVEENISLIPVFGINTETEENIVPDLFSSISEDEL